MQWKKALRVIALLLSLVMLATSLPLSAFALEADLPEESEVTVNPVAPEQTYTYDTFSGDGQMQTSSQVSTLTNYTNTNTVTSQYSYSYDDNGNIVQVNDASGVLCRYEYDSLNQLTREDNRLLSKSFTYEYDNAGNITAKKTYAYTTGTLGTATHTQTYGYNDATWGDLLTSVNGKPVIYDAIGNPLRSGDLDEQYYDYGDGFLYEWDGRRLVEVRSYWASSGMFDDMMGVYEYTYNADGIRTSKTVNGVKHEYLLSGSQILAETWIEDGVECWMVFVYDQNGSPVGLRYRTSNYAEGEYDYYLYEKNLQGDVIGIYREDGVKMCTYFYDAWGNVTYTAHNQGSRISYINPFRYRGYYYDTETGYYYLQSRYYVPQWGRFLNADSLLDQSSMLGYNLFAYCGNNPVMYIDSMGHFPLMALVALLLFTPIGGLAVQAATSVVSYAGVAVASIWNEDIREDMNAIAWNPFNNDANAVANSNFVSFYNGVPVFRTDGSSGSFGVILLAENGFEGTSGHYWSPEDILMHEWGHSVQQMTFGPVPYLINIGIPSAFIDNNDNAPWEITADLLGDVNRSYNQHDVKQGWNYFSWGRIIGPFWWW